jgi:hypothetical protein
MKARLYLFLLACLTAILSVSFLILAFCPRGVRRSAWRGLERGVERAGYKVVMI